MDSNQDNNYNDFLDSLGKYLAEIYQTDCCPKNISNNGNPFYEEDPETSRQESIKRSFEPTFGMSAVKQIMKIDYTK